MPKLAKTPATSEVEAGQFSLEAQDAQSQARSGTLQTAHGPIPTPIFMPVGTLGSVKGLHQRELSQDVDAPIILGNTYHLFLRPGTDLLEAAGGLHRFMNWERAILTDSGGYQVYSLADSRKISEAGVRFKSHIDGSYYFLSPESAVEVQRKIGGDIIMAFDECPPYPASYDYARQSMELTHRWLDRCLQAHHELPWAYGYPQLLFPIVQGSTFPELRQASAEFIAQKEAPGYAIGGLSVGEPHQEMYRFTEQVCQVLPRHKPRYLMGVGTPANILECIELGVDMFDCVMPTRNGRNGMVFSWSGIRNMRNQQWARDFSPLAPETDTYVGNHYSKAYVRHLLVNKEMLGAQICSLQNLSFYRELVGQARKKIGSGQFRQWKERILPVVSQRL